MTSSEMKDTPRDTWLKVLSFPIAVTSAPKVQAFCAFHEFTFLSPVSPALVPLCQLHVSLTLDVVPSLSLRPSENWMRWNL